jgi:hypothetical protein
MVAAAHTHRETEPLQQQAQAVERNVCISSAAENFLQQFGVFAHFVWLRGRSPTIEFIELKLFQEPHVVFVEEADVVDAVAEHGDVQIHNAFASGRMISKCPSLCSSSTS